MCVWRHASQTQGQKILIYSSGTGVYNIGLALVQPTCQHVVQINLPQNSPRYIDINQMLLSFQCDPDLHV